MPPARTHASSKLLTKQSGDLFCCALTHLQPRVWLGRPLAPKKSTCGFPERLGRNLVWPLAQTIQPDSAVRLKLQRFSLIQLFSSACRWLSDRWSIIGRPFLHEALNPGPGRLSKGFKLIKSKRVTHYPQSTCSSCSCCNAAPALALAALGFATFFVFGFGVFFGFGLFLAFLFGFGVGVIFGFGLFFALAFFALAFAALRCSCARCKLQLQLDSCKVQFGSLGGAFLKGAMAPHDKQLQPGPMAGGLSRLGLGRSSFLC